MRKSEKMFEKCIGHLKISDP